MDPQAVEAEAKRSWGVEWAGCVVNYVEFQQQAEFPVSCVHQAE